MYINHLVNVYLKHMPMYLKLWCVLLSASNLSYLRTGCGLEKGSTVQAGTPVLSFASALSIDHVSLKCKVCRLSYPPHGLFCGVWFFLLESSSFLASVAFHSSGLPTLSLIIFGWLLSLDDSFKCGHLSRSCPQLLSSCLLSLSYFIYSQHRLSSSRQLPAFLFAKLQCYISISFSSFALGYQQSSVNPQPNTLSFSLNSPHLLYLLGP